MFRHWTDLMRGPAVFTHTGFVNVVAPRYANHLRRNVQMLKGIGVNTTGFSGSGFEIAPAVGLCMAELVTQERAKTVDIEPFNPRRFAESRVVEGPQPYAMRPDHIDPTSAAVGKGA